MSGLRVKSFAILWLAVAAPDIAQGQDPPDAFDVQGHRGARGLAPENTLPAFEKAIALGVTTLELDLQVTSDGVLVVYHDDRLDSKLCASAQGEKIKRRRLSEVEYREIADLDCGSQGAPGLPHQVPFPGARIPRLEEVLELAERAPYPVWVSLEIKPSVGELPQPLDEVVTQIVSEIESLGLEHRTIIQSKWGEVLLEVRDHSPGLGRALVVRVAGARRWVEEGVATIVSRKHVFLRRDEVAKLQQQGIRVIPWTVNKPKRMRRMIAWGVDGVITDYPDRALAVLAE